jgi:thiosulfate dehydrogenase [quinone] large subunit
MKTLKNAEGLEVNEPRILKWLFNDVRAGFIWVFLRVWLGWQWIVAGWHKVTNPAWMVNGSALKGFFASAVVVTNGKGPITYDWYRQFLQYLLATNAYVWFAKLISIGELVVGIALVLGIFTGVFAFFGAAMNFNYMLAGSASVNPVFFAAAVLLVLAYKVAGYIGGDFFLMRMFGIHWKPGS